MNRSTKPARRLPLSAFVGLPLLLALNMQAQIAVQDGLTALVSSGAGPAVNKAFTVTPGASVLVVLLQDRQNSVTDAEPATITWNGTNILTQDTNSFANVSNYRSMAMYHLFNPPSGSGNITATYPVANNTIVVTALTLNGVNPNIAPVILQTNSGTLATYTSLSVTTSGITAGAWGVFGSIWGNTSALTVTNGGNGVVATLASTALGGSSINVGYVTNLNAGTLAMGVTNAGPTKGCLIAEIFAPSPPSPPSISTQPRSQTIFTNGSPKFTVGATGAPPLNYQWFTNGTDFPLSNGGHLTGATNNVLMIANATQANAGNYFVVVTNLYGAATSSVANLAFMPPSGAYESAVMTTAPPPFAYYTFSETNDPGGGGLVAQDSVGSFNGTYGVASQNGFYGIMGPQATADGLPGFPDGNTALGLTGTPNSAVTLPAFNFNNGAGANVLTITAWIHPNGQMPNGAGVVFCRGGSTISGLAYLDNTNNILGYNWANDSQNYTWNSGLVPPIGMWSLVALVVTPTNATVYLFNTNNGMLSSTHVYNHVVQKFDAPTSIGYESYATSRVFNGAIDEVALFNQALTPGQLGALLYTVLPGPMPPIVVFPTWNPASISFGQSSSITVSAFGTPPLSYQWMAGLVGSGIYTNLTDGGNIAGATSATLTVNNAQLANALDYVVVVTNIYGAITSAVPATLTVSAPVPPTNSTLNGLALTPPMGWNAWNHFQFSIDDAIVRATADAMATNGMIQTMVCKPVRTCRAATVMNILTPIPLRLGGWIISNTIIAPCRRGMFPKMTMPEWPTRCGRPAGPSPSASVIGHLFPGSRALAISGARPGISAVLLRVSPAIKVAIAHRHSSPGRVTGTTRTCSKSAMAASHSSKINRISACGAS